ncbi:MAG: hypothetical protein RLZZ161_1854 [Bacteroidota bacterium]|jgi:hypothetical protein
MEAKLLKMARLTAFFLLLLNIFYTSDEFLTPKTVKTTCTEAYRSLLPDGEKQFTIILANHSQIEVTGQVILPAAGQSVLSYHTPWVGGLKAVSYEFYSLDGQLQEQTIGNPNAPRTSILIVSGILFLICIVTLTARYEFAVGTLIFGIILAGVRFWVLK